MALRDTPLTDFNITVNRQTRVSIALANTQLSPVFPTDDPDRVQVRYTLKPNHPYRGSEVLTYQRLDFADLPELFHKPPRVTPGASRLYPMLDDLLQGTGILLTEDDVYDANIVLDPVRGLNVELKARPESYRWRGIYRLYFAGLPSISRVIHRTQIDW